MKNFIARMGYMLTWWLGTPKYSLEEAFEQYYIFGLLITILGIVSMIFLIVIIIWEFKRNRGINMNKKEVELE